MERMTRARALLIFQSFTRRNFTWQQQHFTNLYSNGYILTILYKAHGMTKSPLNNPNIAQEQRNPSLVHQSMIITSPSAKPEPAFTLFLGAKISKSLPYPSGRLEDSDAALDSNSGEGEEALAQVGGAIDTLSVSEGGEAGGVDEEDRGDAALGEVVFSSVLA
jgi:hypothetical protein